MNVLGQFLRLYWRRLLIAAFGSLVAGVAVKKTQQVRREQHVEIEEDGPVSESPSLFQKLRRKKRRPRGGGGMSAAGETTATRPRATAPRNAGIQSQPTIQRPATKLVTALENAGLQARLASRASEAVVLVRETGQPKRDIGAIAEVVQSLSADSLAVGVGRQGEWQVVRSYRDGVTGEVTALVAAGERRVVVKVVDPATFKSTERAQQTERPTGRSSADDFGISRNLRRQ